MLTFRTWYNWIGSLSLTIASAWHAAVLGADTNAVAAKQVLAGLNNPHGVVVRPEGTGDAYEIFVAESGAGRIIKILKGKPEKRVDVVSGFSVKSAGDDGATVPGVYSLYFLDHLRLVATGGNDDGTPFVRIYELAEPESPLTADQHKHEANLPEPGKDPSFDAHVFRSVARTQPNDRVGDFLVAVGPSNRQTSAWAFVPIRAGALGDAIPARLKYASDEFRTGSVAVGKSGYLTVAATTSGDPAQTSSLAFVNPLDRRVVLQVPTDLQDIVALAYSPKTGDLYAANSANNGKNRAGIYRINSASAPGATACTTTKIVDVDHPTALAFAPDGSLYVTAAGEAKGGTHENGLLLHLSGF